MKTICDEPGADASVEAPLFERIAQLLEKRGFIACWNGGQGHDLAASQGFNNASDFIAWTIRQAYHAGWGDREDDLILGLDRIAPWATERPLKSQPQDGAPPQITSNSNGGEGNG